MIIFLRVTSSRLWSLEMRIMKNKRLKRWVIIIILVVVMVVQQ